MRTIMIIRFIKYSLCPVSIKAFPREEHQDGVTAYQMYTRESDALTPLYQRKGKSHFADDT